jgi:phosphate transport system protein
VRTAFHAQLNALTQSIADMCDLAGTAMELATQALLDADIIAAEAVITNHDDLVVREIQAEADAFALLALQAPVAGDLRVVVSSLQNVADLERMGALALHVAKTARRRHPAHAIPENLNGYFAEMARIAVDIGRDVKDVVLYPDPDKATKLVEDDDAMDVLHRDLFSVLLNHRWPFPVATAVDVTLVGRYYERFADHAVEIGRRVIFQITGTNVDAN